MSDVIYRTANLCVPQIESFFSKFICTNICVVYLTEGDAMEQSLAWNLQYRSD